MIDPRHFPIPLQLQMEEKGRKGVLLAPFIFIDGRTQIIVPRGFISDFHSSPRGLWNVFPPWEYPEAAVVHDYLYRHPLLTSRGEADRIHRRILELTGASRFKRWAAWLALRSFGWIPWRKIPDMKKAPPPLEGEAHRGDRGEVFSIRNRAADQR